MLFLPPEPPQKIQKARRATPASKPMCNTKGTTCSPPWNSTYPCPIPSVLAKCFHPRLNPRPHPQVLYTEVCTQAFAILLPPHSLLIQTCWSFTSLCACVPYISWHSSSLFHSDGMCPATCRATTAISSLLWSGLSCNCHSDTQGWPSSFCTTPQTCRGWIQYWPDTTREEPKCPGRSTRIRRGRRQQGEDMVPHRDEGCTRANTLSYWEHALVCPGAEPRWSWLLFCSCKGRRQEVILLTVASWLRSCLRWPVVLSSPK